MIDLYDQEVVAITQLSSDLSHKYSRRTTSATTLKALKDEATARLLEIGFVAIVDVTPCELGEPVNITIMERVENKPFDYERYADDIRKAYKRNEKIFGQGKIDL